MARYNGFLEPLHEKSRIDKSERVFAIPLPVMSDAAIPRPSQSSPKIATEIVTIQGIIACFRLNEAPRTGDFGDDNLDPAGSRLLSVLGFPSFVLSCSFCLPNLLLFVWGGLSRHHFDVALCVSFCGISCQRS